MEPGSFTHSPRQTPRTAARRSIWRRSTPTLLIAAVCSACGAGSGGCSIGIGTEGSTAQGSFKPVATIDQVMDAIVIPSSQAIFDAVVYENGVLAQSPKTDDDWFRVRMHALAVAEAGNLLLMPSRIKDEGEWVTFSHALTDRSVAVANAAEAKDIDALLRSGGELYEVCAKCHAKYLAQD